MDASTLSIRDSVRLTVSIYNSAVDRGAYHELDRVFAPDGEMTINADKHLIGRDKVIEGLTAGAKLRGAYEEGNFQRHNLGNSIINVMDARHARSVHYIIVITELGLDHAGVYIDNFVFQDDQWWIKTRRANMEWARPESRFFTYPGRTYIARPDELDVGLAGSS